MFLNGAEVQLHAHLQGKKHREHVEALAARRSAYDRSIFVRGFPKGTQIKEIEADR